MAISATNTRQSQLAVESALQERRRKEALQRKQQEEREAKEREQEKKLRLRRLEEEKREQERQLRLEQERQAKALALQRKEEAQREALRHGPKKAAKLAAAGTTAAGSSGSGGDGAPKWPMSASAAAKARALDDSDGESPGLGLTREELRKKKQEAELRRLYKTSKKSTHSSRRTGKNGLYLPGGALNVVKPEEEVEDPNASQGSVRDRLLNKPIILTKLNIVKKDQRTIFEQLEDARAAKKVLDGHEALQFDSWFSTSKKKETDKKKSPAPMSSTASQSGANSPAPRECLGDSFVSSLISLSCAQVLNRL